MFGLVLGAVWWVAIGVVLKTLVPMPFLDDPIRAGWRWLKGLVVK